MHILPLASRPLSLALLFLPSQIHAQGSDAINRNLTLRFFTTTQDDSCDFGATSQAITFTTASIPVLAHCFDLADLFDGNATSGFVNQSTNILNSPGEYGIHWSLSNAEAYNASANYSSVLYRQHISNPNTKEQEPGSRAERITTLYGGKGCTQIDPNDDKDILPWYGFSCWSEAQGSCGTTSYNIQSFTVQPRSPEAYWKCWVFAKNGQSGAVRVSGSLVAALLGTGLTVWLAL
ncbi:hypothetical protein BDW02DRAFT_647718 [Decorospora gaudefroyi]|uniref:AA1-like domain-containing protein n=1 Tax=Decorospora gaudefroyi TaxID=184978 RepID=A0A6A5KA88_9PLEO|nr:hypothetical protein BDW02DRAFT_647718 [Decorospora gaudefroyi]